MKKILYTLIFSIGCSLTSFGQQWTALGTQGYSAAGVQYPDLAVYNGTPYVAFKDAANAEKCTVMKYIGSSWVVVGSAGFSQGIARDQSIAIDQQNGTVYVAYSDAENGSKTTVMKFNGTSWELVGTAGFSAMASYQSLVIDNGIPYVAFSEYYTKMMKFNGTSWEYVGGVLPGSVDASWYTKLAMYNHQPYVVYRDIFNGSKTTVVHLDANGSWEPYGAPAFSDGDSKYQSIDMDANGVAYVAYQDMANGGRLTVKKYENSAWVTVGTQGFSLGLAVVPILKLNAGIPYVVFRDESEGNKLTVMKFDGSNWVAVGGAGITSGAAFGSKLVFDGGVAYVNYGDETVGNKAALKKYDTGSNLGIVELNNVNLSVYPNPSNSMITLSSNEAIETVEIYDISGKLVQQENVNSFSIEQLEVGVYQLIITTSKGIAQSKLIKE
jgi:hypothetical protein